MSSTDASNTQEETTDRDQLDTGHHNSEEPHWLDNFPQQIPDYSPEHNSMEQQFASTDNNVFDEIPQLEEDRDNGQFTDADTNLINRHNTHSESERIQKE